MKITAIVCQPLHCDFPLFRYNLKRFSKYIDNLVIVFSDGHTGNDYREFFIHNIEATRFVNAPADPNDWRNAAVKEGLKVVEPDTTHYLFLEQDFLMKGDEFWEKVRKEANEVDFISYHEDERIHPAFALVAKNLVYRTSKDFSAHPPEYDHFGKFFQELGDDVSLKDMGLLSYLDYYHLAGLTQNFACYANNQPFYKPDEFLEYMYLTNRLDIPKEPNFDKICHEIEGKFGRGDAPFLQEFFK